MLLQAYDRWGDACVVRLRGDFAFVVWDGSVQKVLAARDPFGVRLLNYASSKDQLLVASDVDQLLATGLVPVVPDEQMVVEFLTRDFRTLDRSYFREIRRIPPGHLLVATSRGLRTAEHRSPPEIDLTFSSNQECHEAFRDLFFSSVRRRVSSVLPVVAQLSGGIDSTSIVCVADRILRAEPGLTPAVFAAAAVHPGLPCDESTYIDAVAAHVQIPVLRWDGTRSNTIEFTEAFLAAPGNRMPMAGGTDGFAQIAREHDAGVVLDGTGGDQLGRLFGVTLDEIARGDWRSARRHLFPPGISLGAATRALLAVGFALSPPWLRAAGELARRKRPAPVWLVAGAYRAHSEERLDGSVRHFSSHGQRLRWESLSDAGFAISVEKNQRFATQCGLDLRFPFLDWDLVTFILAVPQQYWPQPRWLARFHREALRADLPETIYRRQSKAEFTSAMTNRVMMQLSAVSDLLDGGTWISGAFVDQLEARRLLAAFRKSPSADFEMVHQLWAIGSLETWLRTVLRYRTVTP